MKLPYVLLGIFLCSSSLGVRYADKDLPTTEEIGPLAHLIYPTDRPYPTREHIARQLRDALKEVHRLDTEERARGAKRPKSASKIAQKSAHSEKIVPLVDALTPFLRTFNAARTEGFLAFLDFTDNKTRCAVAVRTRSFFASHMTVSDRITLLWFFSQMHRKKIAGLDRLSEYFSEGERGRNPIPENLKSQVLRCADWGYTEKRFSRTSKNRLESMEDFFTISSSLDPRKNPASMVPLTIEVLNHLSPQNRFPLFNFIWDQYTIHPLQIKNGLLLQKDTGVFFDDVDFAQNLLRFLFTRESKAHLTEEVASSIIKMIRILSGDHTLSPHPDTFSFVAQLSEDLYWGLNKERRDLLRDPNPQFWRPVWRNLYQTISMFPRTSLSDYQALVRFCYDTSASRSKQRIIGYFVDSQHPHQPTFIQMMRNLTHHFPQLTLPQKMKVLDLAAGATNRAIPLQEFLDLISEQSWQPDRALTFLENELSRPSLTSQTASKRLKSLRIAHLDQRDATNLEMSQSDEILDLLVTLYHSRRDFSETQRLAQELRDILTTTRYTQNALQEASYATRDLMTRSMSAHDVQAIFRAFLNSCAPEEIVPRREAVIEQLTADLLEHDLTEAQRFHRIIALIQNPLSPLSANVGYASAVSGVEINRQDIRGQEAVWHAQRAIISDYRSLEKHEIAGKLIQTHLPTPQEAKQEYFEILEKLEHTLTAALSRPQLPREKFRLEKSRNALPYFKGRSEFKMHGYGDLPNLYQLFGLFYRLNTLNNPDLRPNLVYYLTQHFSEFQSIFPNLAGGYGNAGHFFANREGEFFINEIWKVYQGKSDTLTLSDHKIDTHQARFLMYLPYHIVQPITDELIQNDLKRRRSTAIQLFSTFLETSSPAFKGEESFVRFVKNKLYLLDQGEALTDLTSPQIAYLKSLHRRLPQLFYLNGVADQLQVHQSKLKESMLSPLFEVFFMALRGHCIKLMDPAEPDKLSCTDGTYLRLLQGIQETITLMLKDGNLINTSAMLQLVRCVP
jgi:hypothetical protein